MQHTILMNGKPGTPWCHTFARTTVINMFMPTVTHLAILSGGRSVVAASHFNSEEEKPMKATLGLLLAFAMTTGFVGTDVLLQSRNQPPETAVYPEGEDHE